MHREAVLKSFRYFSEALRRSVETHVRPRRAVGAAPAEPRRVSLRLLGIVVLFAAANSCGIHAEVATRHDPGLDLSAYGTYAWMSRSHTDAVQPSAALEQVVKTSVDDELNARGFRLAHTGMPDLLVGFRVRFRNRTTDTFLDYYEYRRAGGEESAVDSYAGGYEEGTLLLEIVDAHTRHPLWQASAVTVVGYEPSAERVRDVVHGMFERLPME